MKKSQNPLGTHFRSIKKILMYLSIHPSIILFFFFIKLVTVKRHCTAVSILLYAVQSFLTYQETFFEYQISTLDGFLKDYLTYIKVSKMAAGN